jgi:hypothetical protein
MIDTIWFIGVLTALAIIVIHHVVALVRKCSQPFDASASSVPAAANTCQVVAQAEGAAHLDLRFDRG